MLKKIPLIEVSFTTYSEMGLLEDILHRTGIKPGIHDGEKYFDMYSERDIMGYKGDLPFLYFLVDKSCQNYEIMDGESDHVKEEYMCQYPLDKVKFRCLILKPYYKGRKIVKL